MTWEGGVTGVRVASPLSSRSAPIASPSPAARHGEPRQCGELGRDDAEEGGAVCRRGVAAVGEMRPEVDDHADQPLDGEAGEEDAENGRASSRERVWQ